MKGKNLFKTLMLSLSFVGASIAIAGCKKDVTLSTVEVKDGQVEITVNQGDELDLSSIILKATFSNGETKEITSADFTINEISTDEVGNQTLIITYEGKTVEIVVHVVKKLESLAVKTLTNSTIQFNPQGTNFAPQGLVLTATYANDSTEDISDMEKISVSALKTNQVGTFEVTFSYGGKQAKTNVTIQDPYVALAVKNSSVKANYLQYEEVDLNNLVVVATKANDQTDELRYGAHKNILSISAEPTTTTAGDHSYTIKFNNDNAKAVNFDYTVSELQSIELIEYPEEVKQNSTLKESDITLKGNYAGNRTATVSAESITLDTTETGVNTLTVAYKDKETSVDVYVVEDSDNYSISQYSNPSFVTEFRTGVVKNTYTSTTQTENVNKGFEIINNDNEINLATIYKVGSDNPFKYAPTIRVLDYETEEAKVIVNFARTIELYKYNDALTTDDKFEKIDEEHIADYVTIEGTEYKFVPETANGKIFRIVVTPKYNTSSERQKIQLAQNSGVGVFTFQVVSGWNVYTAADLSVFDNFNAQLDINNLGEFNMKGDERPDTSSFDTESGRKWTKLKEQNGIALDNPATALILHRNIILTWEDIPSVHTYAQPTQENPNQRFFVDRDSDRYGSVYVRYLTNENDSFTIEGNFFTIDSSNLPVAIREAGNDEDTEEVPIVSHSTLFKVCGNESSGAIAQTQHFNINNLSMLGNSNKSENSVNWGGIISFKIETCNSDINNCLVKSHYIAMMYNGNCAAANDVISNIKNTNMFDSNNCLVYCSEARHLNLENCNLIGAGGPVMINDYNYDNIYKTDANKDLYTFNSDNEAIDEYGNKVPLAGTERATNVTVKNCVLESYVVGTEPWFSSFGKMEDTDAYVGAFFAATIKSFNNLYVNKGYHKTYVTDGQMNIIALYKSGKAATISADSYQVVYGSFADYTVDEHGNLINPYPMDATKTNSAYPIFATSNAPLTVCLGDSATDAGYQAFLTATGLTDSAILYNLYYSRKYDAGFLAFLAGYYNTLPEDQKAQITQEQFVEAYKENTELYVACWQNKYTAFQQFCIGYYNSQLTTEQKAAFGNSTDAFTTYGLTNDDVYYGYVMTLQYSGVPGDAEGTNWAAGHDPVAAVVDTANDYLYIYFNNGCVFILGLFPKA